MTRRFSTKGITNALVVALLAGILATQAIQATANHQPADKVNASGSKIVVVEPEMTNPAGTTILQETFKTSSPTDLMLQLTLECSIITEILNQGGPDVAESTGEAEGRIRVWLEFDGKIVPINSVSRTPQPHNPSQLGDDTDKVTFCNREHRMTVTDTEQGLDGTDTYRTYIRTKAANAFNWVYLNTGNGLHTVTVKATYDEPVAASEGSNASGLIGNRMLIVEPTKMSNHEAV